MFWEMIGYSVVIFSIGGTVGLILIAVALLNLADAKMKWVQLRREMFEDDAVTTTKNKFKRSVTKNKG
jgi:uncharacterized membrane protein YidH (DUF202 family)